MIYKPIPPFSNIRCSSDYNGFFRGLPGGVVRVGEAIQNHARFWSIDYRYLRADGSFAYVIDRGYFI